MLSIQPCNSVSFGFCPAPKRGFSVAEEFAFRKEFGQSAPAIESKLLADNGLLGKLPSTQGGSKYFGIESLAKFYKQVDDFLARTQLS